MISSIVEVIHLVRTVLSISDEIISNSNNREPELYSALREIMEEDRSKLFETQHKIKLAAEGEEINNLNELIVKRTAIAESAKAYAYVLKEHIENVGIIREKKKLAIISAQNYLSSVWTNILCQSTEMDKSLNTFNLCPINDWEEFVKENNPYEQLLNEVKQAKESITSILVYNYLLLQRLNSTDVSDLSYVLKLPEISKLIELYELHDLYVAPLPEDYYLNIIKSSNINFANQNEIQLQIDVELKNIREQINRSMKTFEFFIDRTQRFLENIWQQNLFDFIEFKNMNSIISSWCQTVEILSDITSLQKKIDYIVELNANYEESLISLDMSRIDTLAELDKCYLVSRNTKLKGISNSPIIEKKEIEFKNHLLQIENEFREFKRMLRSWYSEQTTFAYSTAPELFYYLPDLLHPGSILGDGGYEHKYNLPRRRLEEFEDVIPLQVADDKYRTSRHALYRANIDNKEVVLKRFPMHDIHQRKGFERELSILSRYHSDYIIHPNAIVESGTSTDVPQFQASLYIEYTLMRGGDLSAWLKSSRQSWELQRAARQILFAIIFIHSHNIIHMDIKPGNVLLREDGRMLLTDFEFSIDLDQYSSESSHYNNNSREILDNDSSVVVAGGTRGYMAPEVERGEFPLKQSDMYSYGAMLFFMYFPSEFALLKSPLTERTITIPDATDSDLVELLLALLHSEYTNRPTAKDTLQFTYFSKCFEDHILQEGEVVGQDRRLMAIRNLIHHFQSNSNRKKIRLQNPVEVAVVEAVLGHFSSMPIEEVMHCKLTFDMNEHCYELQDILPFFFTEIYNNSCPLFVSGNASLDSGHHQIKTQSPSGHQCYFLPSGLYYSLEISKKLRGFGRLLAKILSEGLHCYVNQLCPSLFKYLTGASPTIRDLQIFDPQISRMLRWNRFSNYPSQQSTDKIGNTTIDISNYVTRTSVMKVLIDDRKLQLEAIKTGFIEALTAWSDDALSLLSLLSFADLYTLISDESNVDVSDIISSLEFVGFPSSSPVPLWTKELLLSFSRDYLLKFLVFVTGVPNIPPCSATSPLSSFKITVNAQGIGDELPVAYPCFFHLDLPDYDDKELFRTKLTFAIQHSSSMI